MLETSNNPLLAQQPAILAPVQPLQSKPHGRGEARMLVKKMVATLEAIKREAEENMVKSKRRPPEFVRMVEKFRGEGDFDEKVDVYADSFGHLVLGNMCDAELRRLVVLAGRDPTLRRPLAALLDRRDRQGPLEEEPAAGGNAANPILEAENRIRRAAALFEAMDVQARRGILNTVRPSPQFAALAARLADERAISVEFRAARGESHGEYRNTDVANLLSRRFEKHLRRLDALLAADAEVRSTPEFQRARRVLAEQRERLNSYWSRRHF